MKNKRYSLVDWHVLIMWWSSCIYLSLSNRLTIHRTKLEKADELYKNHAGDLLSPPTPEELANMPELVKYEFNIREPKTDVVFSGLGWVTVNEPGAKIVAHVPKSKCFTT